VNGVEDDPDTGALDDTDDSDYLNGGGGDDIVIAGNDDVVTSGEGADTIVGGSWIEDGRAMDIMDFDAQDDNILLIYDDDADVPDIRLEADPDDPEVTQVFMDGIAVANILNGADISIEDISIMPLSLAQSAGMAPA
ncbi:MAG: calcium-binding protein, partial [Pseudomonadota bacterium]